jgi:hypothetical protein
MLFEQLCQGRYNSSLAHTRIAITGASAISKLIPDDVSGSISYPTLHLSLSVIRYLTIYASQELDIIRTMNLLSAL